MNTEKNAQWNKPATEENKHINSNEEKMKTKQGILLLVKLVVVPMTIGGILTFFFAKDIAFNVWAVIGPIITSIITSVIVIGKYNQD